MKKLFSLLIVVVFIVFCFTGCASKSLGNDKNSSNNDVVEPGLEVETMNTIIGSYNGKDITRVDVGSSLYDAEKRVFSDYAYNLAISDFYENLHEVTVTDDDVNLNLELVKSQIGEDNWQMYLFYYANGSEETFKEQVRKATIQEAYITEVQKGIEESITKEDLSEIYDKDPDANNILVLDVIPLNTEEELNNVVEWIQNGLTIEEMADSLETEVLSERYAYFDDGQTKWSMDLHNAVVGDIVYTSLDSGTLLVGRIVGIHVGIDDDIVYETLFKNEAYYRASSEVEKEFKEFLETKMITFFGEEVSLSSIINNG